MRTLTRVLFAALSVPVALLLTLGPAGADATAPMPRWTRPLAAVPDGFHGAQVLQPLPDGKLLVRNGDGVIAVDARGRTLWSEPNVRGVVVNGATVVLRRSGTIFAVRIADAGVLWKRACGEPPYLVTAADRVVTMCGNVSLVLRARDGAVLSKRVPHFDGTVKFGTAQPLNDDYAMATYWFEGAWVGAQSNIVDAHTGEFLWGETNAVVVGVDPTTISLTPANSTLPWQPVGTIQRFSLSNGRVLSTEHYAVPAEFDDNARGSLVVSDAAAYVEPPTFATFRFPLGTKTPELLLKGEPAGIVTLGKSAFLLTDKARSNGGPFYLDRPDAGTFTLRPWGHHAGSVHAESPNSDSGDAAWSEAIRLGNRIAIPDEYILRLYDERGHVEMTVQQLCAQPELALTRTTLFMRCATPDKLGTLTAFPRP